MAVRARNAVCLVSTSFLPAERNSPSASNAWAAWAFCSDVKVLWTPHHVNETRQAAMVVRSRWAALVVTTRLWLVTGSVSRWSSKVDIIPPFKATISCIDPSDHRKGNFANYADFADGPVRCWMTRKRVRAPNFATYADFTARFRGKE